MAPLQQLGHLEEEGGCPLHGGAFSIDRDLVPAHGEEDAENRFEQPQILVVVAQQGSDLFLGDSDLFHLGMTSSIIA